MQKKKNCRRKKNKVTHFKEGEELPVFSFSPILVLEGVQDFGMLFWAKDIWETADTGRALWTYPFLPKNSPWKLPMSVQMFSLYEEEKKVLITRDWKLSLKCICAKKVTKTILIFHKFCPPQNPKTSHHFPIIYYPFPRILYLIASSQLYFFGLKV